MSVEWALIISGWNSSRNTIPRLRLYLQFAMFLRLPNFPILISISSGWSECHVFSEILKPSIIQLYHRETPMSQGMVRKGRGPGVGSDLRKVSTQEDEPSSSTSSTRSSLLTSKHHRTQQIRPCQHQKHEPQLSKQTFRWFACGE